MKKIISILGLSVICLTFTGGNLWAGTAAQIDSNIEATLSHFYDKVPEGKKLVNDAKGTLVFPNVYKAGFGIGGEYGEGALKVDGKTVAYYNTVAGSLGFQIGAQKKSIIILFMRDEALKSFRESSGWNSQ